MVTETMWEEGGINGEEQEYRLGSYGVPCLGVDNNQRRHYWDDENDRMLVARNGDVIRRYELNGRSVPEYVAFVAQECGGWRVTGGEAMLEAVAGAFGEGV